jgi:UPF0271 protein
MTDLSADLGEASNDEERAVEAAIWPLIAAANVACGGHAGNAQSMRSAAQRARELSVQFGAHPSYPDRANFGRRSLQMEPDDLHRTLAFQLAVLRDVAASEGVTLTRVKAHGALYNDAHRDAAIASSIVDAMLDVDETLAIVAPATSEMARVAARAGVVVIREAFADRRYLTDGSLMPRSDQRALLSIEEAADQATQLVEHGSVIAADGTTIELAFDTICIHADMAHAVERLQAIRTRIGL